MVDRFNVHIHIGGPISPDLAKELLIKINDEGLHFAYGPQGFEKITIEDLIENTTKNGENPILYDFERAAGDFTELTKWLIENDIPFDQHCEGKFEYDPDITMFRSGMEDSHIFFSAQDSCDPLVRREPLLKIIKILKDVRNTDVIEKYSDAIREAIKELNNICVPEIGPLPPFKIED